MATIKVIVTDDEVTKQVEFVSQRAEANIDDAIYKFIDHCDPVKDRG